MRTRLLTGAGTLMAAFLMSAAMTLGAPATLTGTVSDTMCGADHMGKDPATCTRHCLKNGADYALVVGEKVYTLKTTDAKLRTALDKLAGAKATVSGDEDGTTISVTDVQQGT
jgi:hypothetical protein